MTMTQLVAQELGTTGVEITRVGFGASAKVDALLAAVELHGISRAMTVIGSVALALMGRRIADRLLSWPSSPGARKST